MERVPERILTYGGPGAGKSRAWLSIAQSFPDRQMFVLDTDNAARRMLTGEFEGLANVKVYECSEWEECVAAVDDVEQSASEGDWLVVDFISSLWEQVQHYYVREIWQMDPAEFYLMVRREIQANKQGKRATVFEGWKDWPFIKQVYNALLKRIKYGRNLKGVHVYATATLRTFQGDEQEDLRTLFAGMPGYPGGEKHLGFEFHTVLLLQHQKGRYWTFRTVKDRERELFDEPTELTNFALRYVRGVAGLT